jgi:hypothetical protein
MKKQLITLITMAILMAGLPLYAQLLPLESFETAVPPTGWNVSMTGDAADPGFLQTDGSSPFFGPSGHTGTYSAAHNDDNLTASAESWLVTPQLAVPAGTTYVHFFEAAHYPTYYEYHGLWISTGDGDPANGAFVELQEIDSSGYTADEWHSHDIDLSSYTGQSIYLAFRYTGDYADEWYVDDVEVNDSVPVELQSFSIE